jgi:predicted lipoprotein with Yx(FWY)xxD motif
MKRLVLPSAAIALLALAASAPASSSNRATVKVGNTSLGKILERKSGFTLYEFTRDRRNKDTCVSVRGCAATWPPLTTGGKPMAGPGVKSSLLGTITLAHGVKQVTYAGHPLYTYSGDSGPGQVDYVSTPEFGGTWNAANAAGHMVK